MYIIYTSDNCAKCLKAINIFKLHNSKYIIRKIKRSQTFSRPLSPIPTRNTHISNNKKSIIDSEKTKTYNNRIVLQKELEILMNDQWEKYLIHLGVDKHTKDIQLNELINLPIIYDIKNKKYIGSYEDLLKQISQTGQDTSSCDR